MGKLMRKIATFALLCCAFGVAHAQNPGRPTFGSVGIGPSTTGGATLNLQQGTAPTSPNNGDIWSTSGGLYGHFGGSTVGPFGSGGGGGGCSPGGASGNFQYNNGSGGCAGSSSLVYSTGTVYFNGVMNGGAISTPTIDGSVIGGTTPAAGTFTTATFNTVARLVAPYTWESATAPGITTGFGTGDAITPGQGTAGFQDTVGSSPSTTLVLSMPAGQHGWVCHAHDLTTRGVYLDQTATTTNSVSFISYNRVTGIAAAPTASDVIAIGCAGL